MESDETASKNDPYAQCLFYAFAAIALCVRRVKWQELLKEPRPDAMEIRRDH